MPPKKIFKQENYPFKYSICTFVTNLKEYSEMVASFIEAGFEEKDCEYIYVDNSEENEFEAFGGINRFLREAKGEYIIVCHQDVLIKFDKRDKLEKEIKKISTLDSQWGILGNAGPSNMYNLSRRYTDGDLKSYNSGVFPAKVSSLDENFLLLKADANLAVAGDLSGFHLYGTDICLVAECLGFSAYVIDFNIIHKGKGTVDQSFHSLSNQVKNKYSNFFRPRYVRTTITRFYLSPNPFVSTFMNLGFVKSISRLFYKLRHRIKGKI